MSAAALDMVLAGEMDELKSTTPSNADRALIRIQPLSENSAQLELDTIRTEMLSMTAMLCRTLAR